jgi:tetratricopeptide (TPR) repeat protein
MLGEYDKMLVERRKVLSVAPGRGGAYVGLMDAYGNLNRLEEAQAAAKEAQAKGLDSLGLHVNLYELAFLNNDAQGMAREVTSLTGTGLENMVLPGEADTAAYGGHLEAARDFSRKLLAWARRAEQRETAARAEAGAGLREILFGYPEEARKRVSAALELSTGRDIQYAVALVLASAGAMDRAQALAADLAKRFPTDTLVQFHFIPTILARVALSRHDPSKAIDVLRVVDPYELGQGDWPPMVPVYTRGEAYLAAQQGRESAAEFQKILDHRGIVVNQAIGALARLGLGRAYALIGDTAKARVAYQDFLTLWKEADPGIPILKEAQAEYQKIK